MHYFIDHESMPSQSEVFGPDGGTSTVEYNITSKFTLTTSKKAYACLAGNIIVQQSDVDSDLVNIILKPKEALKINFTPVKYFVYRGINKGDIVSGTEITPSDPDNIELIAKIWEEYELISEDEPTAPEPTPLIFGFDDGISGTTLLKNLFDGNLTAKSREVAEGEWIGNFTDAEIGFEVIVDEKYLAINFALLRAEKITVDVTGLSGLELKANREKILNFIDPCCLWGLHFFVGVSVTTYPGGIKTTTLLKGEDVYTELIEDIYSTQNRVYLDIRSEKGYSYNFYNNYIGEFGSGLNIKIGNSETTPSELAYSTHDWPIIFIDTVMDTSDDANDVKFNLRLDDNVSPILFFENIVSEIDNDRSPFLDAFDLSYPVTGWTTDIDYFFPNISSGGDKLNVAFYIKGYYFRQEDNAGSPDSVLSSPEYFSNIFGPLELPDLGVTTYTFQHAINSDNLLVRGNILGGVNNIANTCHSGAYYDNSRVAFYVKRVQPSLVSIDRFYENYYKLYNFSGFTLDAAFPEISFLAHEVSLTRRKLFEDNGTGFDEIYILDFLNNSDSESIKGSILCLCITEAQLSDLMDISGFSEFHNRYIYMEEITGSPFEDRDNVQFRKFKLKVQGLDSSGNEVIQSPTTDIYVYSALDGFLFASNSFATPVSPGTYQRNNEELLGSKTKTPTLTFEDYFVGIDSNMKNLVEDFIDAVSIIVNDEDAYENIKDLVNISAKSIFDEAVTYCQTNYDDAPQMDDRILYWARLKMEYVIKTHPSFNNDFDPVSRNVYPGSKLDSVLKLFETKSRNWDGVDFSATPAGAKRILINGFDPFALNTDEDPVNNNTYQSNPSAMTALTLHGNTYTSDYGSAFIQVVLIPNRYLDFNNLIIESLFEKFINPEHPEYQEVDEIITISQALKKYWIDRFPGKTRYPLYGPNKDNNLISETEFPAYPNADFAYKEFYQTTLPYTVLFPATGTPYFPDLYFNQDYWYRDVQGQIQKFNQFPYSHSIQTSYLIESGGYITSPPNYVPSDTNARISKAIWGSGGNYFSNEIFYRVARLRDHFWPTEGSFKSGHLHIVKLQEPPSEDLIQSDPKFKNLIEVIKSIILKTLAGL